VKEMVVKPVNKVVDCVSNTINWTTGAEYIIRDNNDTILKQAKFYFAPGCGGFVDIRIRKNKGVIIPDPANAYSDAYVGDDILIPVYISTLCKTGDSLEIQYRNTDKASNHSIEVIYEFQNVPVPSRESVFTKGKPQTALLPKDYRVKTKYGEGIIRTYEDNARTIDKKTDGYESDEVSMSGSIRDDSGNWEDDLPGFLKTDTTSNGGQDPRKRKRGRGGA
jgi:hypothetical protein